ncbi:MAG: ATP-binding cassette domain-containing protein, partial [Gammaproteobacteria bacterium]|nr:ATP-binding cassette domain-containing protein [Gammaproteobacteria bacterium]
MKSVHKLLEIEDLQLTLPDRSRRRPFGQIPEAKILTNISLAINEGESLGVVGDSGSGKTSLGRT